MYHRVPQLNAPSSRDNVLNKYEQYIRMCQLIEFLSPKKRLHLVTVQHQISEYKAYLSVKLKRQIQNSMGSFSVKELQNPKAQAPSYSKSSLQR